MDSRLENIFVLLNTFTWGRKGNSIADHQSLKLLGPGPKSRHGRVTGNTELFHLDITLTSSLNTEDCIILRLFNPPAISSKSITDLQQNIKRLYSKTCEGRN